MDEVVFLRVFLSIYTKALQEGHSTIVETVGLGKIPLGKTFNGSRIEWLKIIVTPNDDRGTWIGIARERKRRV